MNEVMWAKDHLDLFSEYLKQMDYDTTRNDKDSDRLAKLRDGAIFVTRHMITVKRPNPQVFTEAVFLYAYNALTISSNRSYQTDVSLRYTAIEKPVVDYLYAHKSVTF